MYTQRRRLRGSRFQKEKFILHHQPLNHTKTFLIHHLTWFLSRRLGVRMEFQSWSGKSSRSPHPPRVWRPKSSPRRDWRRFSAQGMLQEPNRFGARKPKESRAGEMAEAACVRAGITRLHLPERPHLCRARIQREGRRNERRWWRLSESSLARGASIQLCPHLGPVAPIPSATTNPVCLDLHPGARQLLPHLLCPPLRLLILPVCS